MSSDAMRHEALLMACWLIADPPPVVACLPAHWLTDPDARRIWRSLQDGQSPLDAVRFATGGDGSILRWCLQAISDAFLWNARWHASRIHLEHHRRSVRRAYVRWLEEADRNITSPVPALWPCWEAAAIDEAPSERAAAALLDEQRRGEAWTEDRQLLWVLSARIEARRPPNLPGA